MSRPTALVTGAGRGVGFASVVRLLEAGWRVTAGVRDVARAREEYGRREGLLIVPLDVSDRHQVPEAVAAAEDFAGGALACLVNNAGYALLAAQEDADLDDARRMFETNLWGAAACVQAALPAMRAAGAGVVVNVSSIGDRLVNPLLGFYHASKYAMGALSEALAQEAGHFGIRVVLIEPGMVDTDFPKATRLSGSVATFEGPYAGLLGGIRGGFAAWREMSGTTGDEVAQAVVRAATDPSTPFRLPVGGDAEHLDRLMREAPDDEAWQAAHRAFLRLDWDPRPAGTA